MKLDDLYRLSFKIKDIMADTTGKTTDDFKLTCYLGADEIENIDKCLYETVNGNTYGFKGNTVVTATINGVRFELVRK